MSTMYSRRFRFMLERRGLLMPADTLEERFTFMLAAGAITTPRHPKKVREAVIIAKALYDEGLGEHGELVGLFARREDLESPVAELREIAWIPYSVNGAGLNPDKWVRLDAWLDDQFLLEDVIAKWNQGVPI